MQAQHDAPEVCTTRVADLALGHQALIVTRGALPPGATWYLDAAEHTLIVAEHLTPGEVGNALSRALTELAAPTLQLAGAGRLS